MRGDFNIETMRMMLPSRAKVKMIHNIDILVVNDNPLNISVAVILVFEAPPFRTIEVLLWMVTIFNNLRLKK